MNRQISRVALASLVLLAALIVATTYWQTWASGGLAARQDNEIQRVAQFEIKRGQDLRRRTARRCSRRTSRKKVNGQDALLPHLPDARVRLAGDRLLDAEPLARRARARGERYLTGVERGPRHDPRHARRPAQGHDDQGQRPRAEPASRRRRGSRSSCSQGKCGAAVVLNPKTGRRLRDGLVAELRPEPDREAERLRADPGDEGAVRARAARRSSTAPRRASSRRARRSRRSPRRPRSTTASTRPSSTLRRPRLLHRVRQAGLRTRSTRTGPRRSGTSNFVQAYEHSINAVFCNIGKKLGARADPRRGEEVRLLLGAAARDARRDARSASGLYNRRRASSSTRSTRDYSQVDPGRLAFGQERMLVTPLQMAMVAAGDRERRQRDDSRQLVKQVRSPGGTVVTSCTRSVYSAGDEAARRPPRSAT